MDNTEKAQQRELAHLKAKRSREGLTPTEEGHVASLLRFRLNSNLGR